jgi:hypothetical protein
LRYGQKETSLRPNAQAIVLKLRATAAVMGSDVKKMRIDLANLGVLVRAHSLGQNKTSNDNRRTTQEEE